MKSQLTTSRTELWILRNVLFPHKIDHIFAKNEKWKKHKTLQRCFKMTNHCTWAAMLKPLHQYVGETRWKYTAKGRNPSANICLIIGSTRRRTEGGAGFISNAEAARLTAQLAWQPSGVIDDTNSKSHWAFVLRRSMKCLYFPEIRERSILKTEAAVALQPFEKTRGFWRLPCVHMEIWEASSREWGQFLCLLFQILCSFLIWKCLRLAFSSFSRLCLAR